MASYKSDADMVDSSSKTIPESEGEPEEIEVAEQNHTVENKGSEVEPQEDEDAEENVMVEYEGSDSELEEVEDGLADEAIMELVECIRTIRAALRERVFYMCIKLHKFESAQSTCTDSKEHCCICLEDYSEGEALGKIDCGHIFHVECLKEWVIFENTCPICKREALARFSRFV